MAIPDLADIGQRARMIRRRRGLSLDVAAGLAGISKPYLSQLENGKRRFERRGLLENLAAALGCSVADLTGQPYPPPDRDTADSLATLPGIRLAFGDYGPDDVPDVTPGPLDEMVTWARQVDEYRDQTRYSLAGRDLGTLVTELHAHALCAKSAERKRAFTALVSTCAVAGAVAYKSAGNIDLAFTAARRGYDMALRSENPGLVGFARWCLSLQLMRLAARQRAAKVLTTGIDELTPAVRLKSDHTLAAEMVGMMHLQQAQTASREQRGDDARAHLVEASRIAELVGERNAMGRHFGPTNVAVWRLGVGIELSDGGRASEEIIRTAIDVTALGSRERASTFHLDLARALAQDGGNRDGEAIRRLDMADRIAPQRVRPDPIARELVATLDRRARRRVWELESLRNRFGVAAPR